MCYSLSMLTPKQRKIEEDREKIKELGQDSDTRARAVVRTLFNQEQLREANRRANYLTILNARKLKNDYTKELAKITIDYLKEEDLDSDVAYRVQYNTIGVIMHLSYEGKVYRRAFRAVRDPHIDLNATKMFAISASGLISKLQRDAKPAFKYS